MHEQQPAHNEQEPAEPPRLYIASLSDYNNGVLHGLWLDATSDPAEAHAAIGSMLAASPSDPRAEEIAIHDYENFGPFRVSEYDPIDKVLRVAQGIAQYGPAFAHWAALVDWSDMDSIDRFDEVYRGHWDSLAAYAEELVTETSSLNLDGIPDWIHPYVQIDWAGIGEALSSELLTSVGDGGVYIFDA